MPASKTIARRLAWALVAVLALADLAAALALRAAWQQRYAPVGVATPDTRQTAGASNTPARLAAADDPAPADAGR